MTGRVATAETDIDAPRSQVWRALTDPDEIQKYMFGSKVETDWKPGSPITWKGEYDGKKYEDKGEILEVEHERRLKLTHFSALVVRRMRPRTITHLCTSSRTTTERRTSH